MESGAGYCDTRRSWQCRLFLYSNVTCESRLSDFQSFARILSSFLKFSGENSGTPRDSSPAPANESFPAKEFELIEFRQLVTSTSILSEFEVCVCTELPNDYNAILFATLDHSMMTIFITKIYDGYRAHQTSSSTYSMPCHSQCRWSPVASSNLFLIVVIRSCS